SPARITPRAAPPSWKSAGRCSKGDEAPAPRPLRLCAAAAAAGLRLARRLAVYLCNNIEHFAFGAGLGSDSTGAAAPQSQRNYAWRDYGNRVGLWYYL